jgi:hypothetical protein
MHRRRRDGASRDSSHNSREIACGAGVGHDADPIAAMESLARR